MTLAELLAIYDVSEDNFVAELSRSLGAMPNAAASQLPEADDYLVRSQGAISSIADHDAPDATLRSASSNLAAQTRQSLSNEQAATLLHVDAARVRGRVKSRALYAFAIGAALRLPVWQFHHHDPIPGLRAVLTTLAADLHPLEIAGFMTTPDPDLDIAGRPTSPRNWLIGGGAVGRVTELAAQLNPW